MYKSIMTLLLCCTTVGAGRMYPMNTIFFQERARDFELHYTDTPGDDIIDVKVTVEQESAENAQLEEQDAGEYFHAQFTDDEEIMAQIEQTIDYILALCSSLEHTTVQADGVSKRRPISKLLVEYIKMQRNRSMQNAIPTTKDAEHV
jgi:hypothetical protein